MSEIRPSETRPKKMVRRSVAIALGIICIILVVGLSGAILQVSSLNSKVSDLTDTLNLGKSAILVNNLTVDTPPSLYQLWTIPYEVTMPVPQIKINHAGYISVNIQSTTNNTYVQVIYSYHGKDNQTLNYDNQMSVSTDEILVFPVLPTPFLEIRVGNTNPLNGTGSSTTVTITYVY